MWFSKDMNSVSIDLQVELQNTSMNYKRMVVISSLNATPNGTFSQWYIIFTVEFFHIILFNKIGKKKKLQSYLNSKL